jgi:hypothetical protein
MNNEKYYVFEAVATNEAASNFNIIACMDLQTGASDQLIGSNGEAAIIESLICQGE